MPLKLIAVDMDGTFLDDHKKYNEGYFSQLFKRMQQQKIEFVVASGNQYEQLFSFFTNYAPEISFVAENGGNIVVHQKYLEHARIPLRIVNKVNRIITDFCPSFIAACGFKSAYILDQKLSQEEYEFAAFYFPKIKKVSSFKEIDDDIIKYSLDFPRQDARIIASQLQAELGSDLKVVPTGGGGIDFILPEVHKANGIKRVQEFLNIADSEVAAFGDNGNDVEMLSKANYSFAMANATSQVKQVAKQVIGDNNHESVLKTIDQLLAV